MAKKKAKKKVAKKASSKEVLVVASKVKAYVKSKKMMTSSDAIAALSDELPFVVGYLPTSGACSARSSVTAIGGGCCGSPIVSGMV